MTNASANILTQNKGRFLLRKIALIISGIFCLGYAVFTANFAELNISFSFLNFPIFIGEILILFLMLVYAFDAIKDGFLSHNKRALVAVSLFVLFVLWKAFYGYFKWGALSFRNAALFYYPIFVLFCYHFYDLTCLKKKIFVYGILFVIGVFFFLDMQSLYFSYTLLTIFAVLVLSLDDKRTRYMSIGLMLLVFPYSNLFNVSRGVLLAETVSFLFTSVVLISFLKTKPLLKALSTFLVFVAFVACVLGFSDREVIKTLMNPVESIKLHKKYSREISKKSEIFVPKDTTVRVFIEENGSEKALKENYAHRKAEDAYKNIIWRLFLWDELLVDFLKNGGIFGVDFGKPFRSKSAEVLRWSAGGGLEGGGVGWIEPHNSYLHMIYRGGIVGVAFILIMILSFVKVTVSFVRKQNIKGILLCSAILYWLILANFSVILELPYFAIPFWGLFGVTLRYAFINKG